MKDDPIVEEVRRIRQEYAAQFNYDLRAMVQDLQKHQQEHADRIVSFSPKPVQIKYRENAH